MRDKMRIVGLVLLVALFAASLVPTVVGAETSVSPNYQMTEGEFNSGTSVGQNSCSAGYCATVTIGSIVDGPAPGSTAVFGPIASDEPLLEVIVDPGESNLGVLDTENTATKTMIVRIRSYMTDGYMLQINGQAPTYDGHSLHIDSQPTLAMPGTEQFGLNVVRNDILEVGADPVQVPDEGEVFGEVRESYNQADRFMYTPGAVVAESVQNSGQTNYTITMVINISGKTPSGQYTSDFSALVIPKF